MHDHGYWLLEPRLHRRWATHAAVAAHRFTQRSRHASGQRLDGVPQLLEIRGDLHELAAEMRLPSTRVMAGLIDRGRRGLTLLRGKPEQLAGMGNIVLNELVEALVKGETLLQGA